MKRGDISSIYDFCAVFLYPRMHYLLVSHANKAWDRVGGLRHKKVGELV